MKWHDPRLNFSDLHPRLDSIELGVKQIDEVWQPDIFFANEKSGDVHSLTTENKLMHILKNGTLIYYIRSMTRIVQPI